MSQKKFTYKEAGVDIEAGEEMVESIKGLIRQTHNRSVLSSIGGFGGFFRPDLTNYKDPVFVSSVDGVGTKLIVAFKSETYDTVGQDLVNHCVNDIAVCGAEPLFFMDYFSTGKLEQKVGYQVVKGFARGCKENGVALIGGETAEMPDIYRQDEFDLAGTIVGIVDRDKIIDGAKIRKGDVLLGFPSSGLHTNGYSLARKVLFSEYEIDDYVEELGTTIGEAMLEIHKSYLPVIRELRDVNGVHGFSHVTGGGIIGNTKRVVPDELTIQLDWESWTLPGIFSLIRDIGNVPEDDMRATFNLGIGLVAIVDEESVDQVKKIADDLEENIIRIGKIKD